MNEFDVLHNKEIKRRMLYSICFLFSSLVFFVELLLFYNTQTINTFSSIIVVLSILFLIISYGLKVFSIQRTFVKIIMLFAPLAILSYIVFEKEFIILQILLIGIMILQMFFIDDELSNPYISIILHILCAFFASIKANGGFIGFMNEFTFNYVILYFVMLPICVFENVIKISIKNRKQKGGVLCQKHMQ